MGKRLLGGTARERVRCVSIHQFTSDDKITHTLTDGTGSWGDCCAADCNRPGLHSLAGVKLLAVVTCGMGGIDERDSREGDWLSLSERCPTSFHS